MKNRLNFTGSLVQLCFVLVSFVMLPSCATIIGGSNYYAHITVNNYPNADINYKGNNMGKGYAAFKAPRIEANTFSVSIKEDNCDEQVVSFTQRSFRGWAFVGTVVGWTGVINGIPLPWGIVVDGLAGAWWKPDITEKGVTKTDYKHYNYVIDYSGCKEQDKKIVISRTPLKNKADRLGELIDLYNKGLISQEEFEKEKKKILEE